MKNTNYNNDIFASLEDKNLKIDSKFKNSLKKQIFNKEATMAKTTKSKISFKDQLISSFKVNKYMYVGGMVALTLVAITTFTLVNNSAKRASLISSNTQLPSNLDGVKTVEEIKAIASADSQGKSISSVELENEEGTLVYKVKYSDGTYRLYDAKTGQAFVKIGEIEKDSNVPANFVAGVTLQQARDIAASKRPGQAIYKIELEVENGVVIYSVKFADGGKVYVNASNGTVVKIENPEVKRESSSGSGSSNSSGSNDRNDDNGSSQEINDDNGGSSGSGSGADDSSSSNDDSTKGSSNSDDD